MRRPPIRDAQFDLDHRRITAPFTGRIGTHQVSVGNLIAGSRAGTSPTTLLATLVSTDSSLSQLRHERSRLHDVPPGIAQKQKGPLADKVQIVPRRREDLQPHEGTLDFIDNTLDRSSGTIHARATVPNTDRPPDPGRLRPRPRSMSCRILRPALARAGRRRAARSVGPHRPDRRADNVVTPKPVQIG